MGPLLALISSATWGLADFLGGLASRRTQIVRVLPVSYLSGAIAVTFFSLFLIPGELNADSYIYGFFAALFSFESLSFSKAKQGAKPSNLCVSVCVFFPSQALLRKVLLHIYIY